MSLYSDDPTEQDPYQALTVALAKPAETVDQVKALQVVSDLLEQQPAAVQTICLPLFEHIKNTGDTVLKRWVLERIAFGVGRSSLHMETKTAIASTVLSDMVQLLQDPSPAIVKLAVEILSSIYPLLFMSLCLARPPPPDQWPLLVAAKTQILSFALAISIEPATLGQPREVNTGVRAIAWKFVQRALMVATRSGSADPRLRAQTKDDPNLNLVPAVHPFIKTADLMNETKQFLAQTNQALANNCENCVLHPIINLIPPLLKARPALAASLIPSLTSWSPTNMQANGCSASQIRAVEKSLKVAMVHLLRTGLFPAFGAQLNDALNKQVVRTLAALKAEKLARHEAALRRAQASAPTTVKREHGQVGQASTDGVPSASKRQRMETPPVKEVLVPVRPGEGLGPDFDVTTLSFETMLELFYITLNGIDERTIRTSIEQTRRTLVGTTAPHLLALATSLGQSSSNATMSGSSQTTQMAQPAPITTTEALPSRLQEDEPDDMLLDPLDEDSAIPSAAAVGGKREHGVKEEEDLAQNPLNMVDEEEEIDPNQEIVIPDTAPEADALPEEALPMRFIEFSLPEVEALSEKDQQGTILQIMRRICRTGGDVQHQMADESDIRLLEEDSEATQGLAGPMISPKEMWILLLARMASRSAKSGPALKSEPLDETVSGDSDWIRKALCDYVLEDFASRSKLARVWLNEEWFVEQLAPRRENGSSYATWLKLLLSRYLDNIEDEDSSNSSLSAFLIDLPDVPEEIFGILRGLCEKAQSAPNGMSTLRDIVTLRPPLRQAAMGLLLDMTTHPDRKIRLVAINTVKRWVPDTNVMSDMVMRFAGDTFLKLTNTDSTEAISDTEPVPYTYLPETVSLPASQEMVQQHSELLFALSVREPQLLDQIFAVYPRCEDSVKAALRNISTPLLRSLGSKHTRLLESLRNFPLESEPFALHVLTVLTDSSRPSPGLVDVIKALAEERDLSAAFLIPIAAYMNRTELYRFLPAMLGVLNESTAETKETIRNVFRNIIPISDIHASTNLPKGKPEEMSAADLLVLLHEDEKKIGVSAAKEAIDICFTLTDRFPSEVLAVVMQRIIDSVSLPILFMRTVIRSVQTYKSLIGYVSTTLLSRLITKKIWTSPQLWMGFIHCVKAIAPASFGALMQLPREQLKELIDKQPSIKPALYQYVVQKAGVAKAQSLADLFGNIPQSPNTAQPISTVT